jgi:hypothetical protein
MTTTSCPSCSTDVNVDDIVECVSCGDQCCPSCSDMDECEVCLGKENAAFTCDCCGDEVDHLSRCTDCPKMCCPDCAPGHAEACQAKVTLADIFEVDEDLHD